jgi:hypothetical protein
MRASILKLPEDMENEIRQYTLSQSLRLSMLLDKYPLANMDIFLQKFSKKQLDKIYRYGCVAKVLEKKLDWYTWGSVNEKIKELLKNDERSYTIFTYTSWPPLQFNKYWKIQSKTRQPTKAQYISSIVHFCNFVLSFSKNNPSFNEQFIRLCEKLVYDVVACSLIMRKNK